MAAGISQAQLAARCGLSKSTVSDIETGALDPRISQIKKLCEALTVDVGYIIDGTMNVATGMTSSQALAFARLPARFKRQVVALMDVLEGAAREIVAAQRAAIGAARPDKQPD